MRTEHKTAFANPTRSSGIEAEIGRVMLERTREEGHKPSLAWLCGLDGFQAPMVVEEVCEEIVAALQHGPKNAAQIRKATRRGQVGVRVALDRLMASNRVRVSKVTKNGRNTCQEYSLGAAE